MGWCHGHGYGHGCRGPEWADREYGYGAGHGIGYDYGRGYGYGYGGGYGRRFGGYGVASRGTAAAQLEAYLSTLRDEVRAVEAELAAMGAGAADATASPQV